MLKCRCGDVCWAAERPELGECEGVMWVSEDYPDMWTHYCTKHGHFEDEYNDRRKDDNVPTE